MTDCEKVVEWLKDYYTPTEDLVDAVYPVGSIYLSMNSASPATLFGGTWERIENKFLLSSENGQGVGDTGGEAEHTLTIEEMPCHNHQFWHSQYNGSVTSYSTSWANQKAIQSTTGYAGGDANGNTVAHNNMPPYLVVNIWVRTG